MLGLELIVADMGTVIVAGICIIISTWLTAWYMKRKQLDNEKNKKVATDLPTTPICNGDIFYTDVSINNKEYNQLKEDIEYYKSRYEEEKRRRECFEHEYGELQKEINEFELQIKREHEKYKQLTKRNNVITEKLKLVEERCHYLRKAISDNDIHDIIFDDEEYSPFSDDIFSYDAPNNDSACDNNYDNQIYNNIEDIITPQDTQDAYCSNYVNNIEDIITPQDTQEAYCPNYVHRNYSSTPECHEISDSEGSVGDEASNNSLCHSPDASEPDFELGNSIMHVIVDHTFLKEDIVRMEFACAIDKSKDVESYVIKTWQGSNFTRTDGIGETDISELVQQNESMLNTLDIDEIVAYNSNCEDDEVDEEGNKKKTKKYTHKDEARIVQREPDVIDVASIPKISVSMQLWEGVICEATNNSSVMCGQKTSVSNPCTRSSSPEHKYGYDSNSLRVDNLNSLSNSMNNLKNLRDDENFERDETFNKLKSKWEVFVQSHLNKRKV